LDRYDALGTADAPPERLSAVAELEGFRLSLRRIAVLAAKAVRLPLDTVLMFKILIL
jgi:hypothetical protein